MNDCENCPVYNLLAELLLEMGVLFDFEPYELN